MDYTVDSQLPGSGPYATVHLNDDGAWIYRWWDSADSFVLGEPPQRLKRYLALGGILAALLSDAARTGNGDRPVLADEH